MLISEKPVRLKLLSTHRPHQRGKHWSKRDIMLPRNFPSRLLCIKQIKMIIIGEVRSLTILSLKITISWSLFSSLSLLFYCIAPMTLSLWSRIINLCAVMWREQSLTRSSLWERSWRFKDSHADSEFSERHADTWFVPRRHAIGCAMRRLRRLVDCSLHNLARRRKRFPRPIFAAGNRPNLELMRENCFSSGYKSAFICVAVLRKSVCLTF